jgi:hypothetical protein
MKGAKQRNSSKVRKVLVLESDGLLQLQQLQAILSAHRKSQQLSLPKASFVHHPFRLTAWTPGGQVYASRVHDGAIMDARRE